MKHCKRIRSGQDFNHVDIPTETGAAGSSNPKMLLTLLKRKELDSKTFSNDEIILGNFKGKDSLPLANRGNTFVSLRGVLEILSKTELSSDIVDNFQDEVFGILHFFISEKVEIL